MAEEKYNRKNPAVKRILQEVKEMQSNPSDDFMSLPLEENIFEWQFAIRGPSDSEFEGGIYHGRIQLPAEYPFKPPSFMLLTPNGRFETQTKICLSISNHHPEHWQPSWSVRTALTALIAFMPTNPNGALGSLDYTKEERRVLAVKSREAAPKFGNPERQQLINEIHEYMLSKSPPVPQVSSSEGSAVQPAVHEGEAVNTPRNVGDDAIEESPEDPTLANRTIEERQEVPPNASSGQITSSVNSVQTSPDANSVQMSPPNPSSVQMSPPTSSSVQMSPNANSVQMAPPAMSSRVQQLPPRPEVPRHADDRLFTWAAIGLTIAILVLVLKKFMKASGYGALFTDGS